MPFHRGAPQNKRGPMLGKSTKRGSGSPLESASRQVLHNPARSVNSAGVASPLLMSLTMDAVSKAKLCSPRKRSPSAM